MDFDMMKLVDALKASMDPNISNVARSQALQYCNSLRDTEQCTHIGLHLVQQSNLNERVKYFGLELIKHKVKMSWISMSDDEKNVVKKTIMSLIENLSPSQPRYFLNAYATILSEIVKHTWPQAWPGMLEEVINGFISPGNLASMEVALVMLLNLVEDVGLYSNIPSQSRLKDLKQAMSLETGKIMNLITEVLQKFMVEFQSDKSPRSAHIISIVLKVTTGYFEWVRVESIAANDYFLVKILCTLLSSEDFRLQAAECLLVMATRRGKVTEKLIIVKPGEDNFVEKYQQSIQTIMSTGNPLDSGDLNFLCKLGSFLAKLVELVVDLYDESGIVGQSLKSLAPFQALFDLLYWFVKHQSRFISYTAIQAWLFLIRGESLRNNETVSHCAVGLIKTIAERITNQNVVKDSTYTDLEEMEINDEDELAIIYKKHKNSMAELFRECVKKIPETAIDSCLMFAESKFDAVRSHPLPKEDLEMVSFFFENGLPHAVAVLEEKDNVGQLPFVKAQNLLASYLTIRVKDPLCRQFLLIVVYKLVDMLMLTPDSFTYVRVLIDYIFEILGSERLRTDARDELELRRHCCAVMLKVVKTRSEHFVRFFDHIKSTVDILVSSLKLSTFEKTSMFEVLVMIAGNFDDPSVQKNIIINSLQTCDVFISSRAFSDSIKTPENFIAACGFSNRIDQPESRKYRSSVHYMLTLTNSLLKRVRESMKTKDLRDEHLTCMNPQVLQAINHGIAITHHVSSVWSPNYRQYINVDILKALDEKKPGKDQAPQSVSSALPYHSYEQSDKSNEDEFWKKLQVFLFRTHEQCFMLLGCVGPALRSNFYKQNCIKDVLVSNVLSKIHFLPMSQLKSLMRQFLSDFVKSCPQMYLETVALPILSDFCQFMIERLHPEWENFAQLEQKRLAGACGGGNTYEVAEEDDEKVSEEIFKEMQLRVISREYLDFLVTLCVNKTPPSTKTPVKPQPGAEDKYYQDSVNSLPISQLTELGTLIAPTPAGEQIWNTALLSLTWHDGQTCCKAASLLSPTLKLAFKTSTTPMSENLVRNLFEGVLRGFNRHGNNPQGEQSLFPIIMAVITRFSDSHRTILTEVLNMAVPHLSENIDSFFVHFHKMNQKKRKLELKKLIVPIVERHVSQRFRDIPDMNQYSSINVLDKKSRRVRFDEETLNSVAFLFQPDNTGSSV